MPAAPVVLAVESSCDETAVAILRGPGELLASAVGSQADAHAATGGVVPEAASRLHLELLPDLAATALRQAGLSTSHIDCFAATSGPGLAPALLVGMSFARGLAIGANKPFYPINHIEGHLLSPLFGQDQIGDFLGLVVSGGHTLLVRVRGFGAYEVIGRTLDDAAGEAFDKVGKLLGLPYPAGPLVDQLAENGDHGRFAIPQGMLHSGDHDFSFSGMKTAVRYLLEKGGVRSPDDQADLCASFRAAVVNVLAKKSMAAARACGANLLAVSGGVSANRALRSRLTALCTAHNIEVRFAPETLCTDNAAMIAFVALQNWKHHLPGDLASDLRPTLSWLRQPG